MSTRRSSPDQHPSGGDAAERAHANPTQQAIRFILALVAIGGVAHAQDHATACCASEDGPSATGIAAINDFTGGSSLDAGCDEYVTKPIVRADLLRACSTARDRKRARAGSNCRPAV
ncbi:MAG: hypothetical protein ACOYN0_04610 [Phycisphaerales bacterium]